MPKQQSTEEDRRGSIQKFFDRLSLSWRLMADRRVGIVHKLIPPLAVLYILSPIDFVPDIFLPFGYIDDIGIGILALEFFIQMAPSDVVREHLNELKSRFVDNSQEQGQQQSGNVVEGEFRYRD